MNAVAITADVRRLEAEILKAPQIDLRTTHCLSGGMYARTIHLDAGTVLTGALHKTDHVNIVCGDISVTTDQGVMRFTGYHVLPTKRDTKRAGFAHGPTAWTTVCKTDKTDLAEIENELVHDADKLQTRQRIGMASTAQIGE